MLMSMKMEPISADEVVLVVIDDDLVLTLLKKKLPDYFGDIYFASNPEEAIDYLNRYRITNLVVDYDLGVDKIRRPYNDGYTLAKNWIREFTNINHAIIFTGEGPEHPELLDIPILHKPIAISELVDAIKSPHNIVRVTLKDSGQEGGQ